jgi:hypothetical protein
MWNLNLVYNSKGSLSENRETRRIFSPETGEVKLKYDSHTVRNFIICIPNKNSYVE